MILGRVESILFICYGNIIRSVFAEKLMKKLLEESGNYLLKVTSAGIKAKSGTSSPENAVKIAKFHHIDLSNHRSTLMTREMVEHADMIVCMEKWHSDVISKQYHSTQNKLYLLSLFEKNGQGNNYYLKYNIPDPYGKEEMVFQNVYERISKCLEELLMQISKMNN